MTFQGLLPHDQHLDAVVGGSQVDAESTELDDLPTGRLRGCADFRWSGIIDDIRGSREGKPLEPTKGKSNGDDLLPDRS